MLVPVRPEVALGTGMGVHPLIIRGRQQSRLVCPVVVLDAEFHGITFYVHIYLGLVAHLRGKLVGRAVGARPPCVSDEIWRDDFFMGACERRLDEISRAAYNASEDAVIDGNEMVLVEYQSCGHKVLRRYFVSAWVIFQTR